MRVIVLLFLTLIVISINAHPVKIGYIDVEKVVNSLSQYQKDNETLSQQFEAKKQELLDLFKHIELLNKNLNNVDKLTNNDAYQKELEKIQELKLFFKQKQNCGNNNSIKKNLNYSKKLRL